MTDRVVNAIRKTKQNVAGYFEKTCATRCEATAVGSYFKGATSADEVEALIISANWEEATHPAIAPNCVGMRTTDIAGGVFGMVAIETLSDDAIITVRDDKSTGMVSISINAEAVSKASETWLILGDYEGHEVVYTFHPGAPVPKGNTTTEVLKVGTILTKQEALQMGFKLVKVAR